MTGSFGALPQRGVQDVASATAAFWEQYNLDIKKARIFWDNHVPFNDSADGRSQWLHNRRWYGGHLKTAKLGQRAWDGSTETGPERETRTAGPMKRCDAQLAGCGCRQSPVSVDPSTAVASPVFLSWAFSAESAQSAAHSCYYFLSGPGFIYGALIPDGAESQLFIGSET